MSEEETTKKSAHTNPIYTAPPTGGENPIVSIAKAYADGIDDGARIERERILRIAGAIISFHHASVRSVLHQYNVEQMHYFLGQLKYRLEGDDKTTTKAEE